MVARQIGERGQRNPNAVQTKLVEAVAGGFQSRMIDAAFRQLGQHVVQRDRIGRGQALVHVQVGSGHAQRAEAGGAAAERGPQLAREGDGRGLAIGAGDGGHGARLRAVEGGGHAREASARVGVGDEGHALRVGGDIGAAQERDRAALARVGDIGTAVGAAAGQRREQKTRAHGTRIRGEAANVESAGRRVEIHGAASLRHQINKTQGSEPSG